MPIMTPEKRYELDPVWRAFVEALERVMWLYERGERRPPWEIEDGCRWAAYRLDPGRFPKPEYGGMLPPRGKGYA
jgi:hypothetical protein